MREHQSQTRTHDFRYLNQTLFKFDMPKTILTSKTESLLMLEKKLGRVLNNRLYSMQEKSFMVSKVRSLEEFNKSNR